MPKIYPPCTLFRAHCALYSLATICLHSRQKSHRGAKCRHPHDQLACQSAAQPGRQTYIMFWADCSTLPPGSRSAIVARAKWMGSEPRRVLNKTPLASNQRLERMNGAVFTGGWHLPTTHGQAGKVTQRKQKRQSTLSKRTREQALSLPPSIPSLLPPPCSFLFPLPPAKVASSAPAPMPCRSGQQ